MSVTVIALLSISEDQPIALGKYLSVTEPLLEKAGAKIIRRFKMTQAVVGIAPSITAVLVEYPNIDAIRSVFESDEYLAIKSVRDQAFSYYSVSIASEFDPVALPSEVLGD